MGKELMVKYLIALVNTNLSYSFDSDPWIFGMAQPTVDDYEVRFFRVQRRDAATLLPIIWKHVYPGTIIWSGEWKVYRRLQTMYGDDHQTVNHSSTQTPATTLN